MTLSLQEAGLVLTNAEDGVLLKVHDASPEGCRIRNRGGESLAQFLENNRQIKKLDIRESKILDNGISHLCLALRQTDQLDELYLSPVGHCGLQFVTGVVHRCNRLKTLHVEVHDVPTLQTLRQKISAAEYDTAAYVPVKKEGEEEEEEAEEGEGEEEKQEEEDEEEDEEVRAKKKADKLRALFAQNDFDSDDEGAKREKAASAVQKDASGASAEFREYLCAFIQAVKKKGNLTEVKFVGDCIPQNMQLELQRVVEDNCALAEKKKRAHEEKGARTAFDALRDQMEELNKEPELKDDIEAILGKEQTEVTRVGMRSYINRRLFAALGEALFECQRFKSKQNAAVSTAEGEMAFIAMSLRKHQNEKHSPPTGGLTGA